MRRFIKNNLKGIEKTKPALTAVCRKPLPKIIGERECDGEEGG